jgi:hypothetical protein
LADTDAVAKRLALRQHEIKPPLGGVDVNRAGPILAYKAHHFAPGRAGAAEAEKGTAHDIAHVEALGSRVAGTGQQCHRCNQKSKPPSHLDPLKKNRFGRETGHNRCNFASHGRVSQ